MNPQTSTELLHAISDLQHDLATLDSIHQNMMRLSEEMASLHDKVNKSMEQVARTISAAANTPLVIADAVKQMQESQVSFNLQYLQLQSQMQHENRAYTAVSNIMKTKHDTVKNSISNIR